MSPSPYTIARLKAQDAKALQRIRLEALQRYPDAYTATYEEEATHDTEWFTNLIASQIIVGVWHKTSELVATARITPEHRPRQTHKGLLSMVYVAPEHQGNGLSKTLILALLDALPESIEQVLLSVESTNTAAISLYESLGFVTYGHEPRVAKRLDGSYLDDILMIKFLEHMNTADE